MRNIRDSTTDDDTPRCLCFMRHHNRTQSVPWIIHRQHQSRHCNCGKFFLFYIVLCMHCFLILLHFISVCTKWGTELTRKSYSHLSRLCREKDVEMTKSMLTFECNAVENQLKKSATTEKLREWWGFFLDPSEVDTDVNNC